MWNKVSFLTLKSYLKTPSHHEHRETKRIVVKSCFSPLSRNQSALERSLTMDKGTQCLSIICENHIFQDPTSFL